MVNIFVFRILKHHTKISLHNNYVLRHYPELYEYLNYEILKWVVHTKIIRLYTAIYNTAHFPQTPIDL